MAIAAVTAYQLAFTVPSRAHAMVAAITEILFPLASASQDTKALRHVYLRMLISSAGLALIVLIPLAIYSESMLTIWIGPELGVQAAPLLTILAVAFFFLALSPAPYHFINGIGKPWINTISYAFNAILNLIFIGLFFLDGITLMEFVWAFVGANVINALLYQWVAEFLVWKGILRRPIELRSSDEHG